MDWQEVTALAVVALATFMLVARAVRRPRPACGGDCACEAARRSPEDRSER
jgi:hypothetical protein